MALRTVLTSTGLPCMSTEPLMRWPYDLLNTLIASSVRPAPMRPAMPTISPWRTCRFTPLICSRSACSAWCTRQSRTSSTVSPIFGERCG
ncbi:hypothetical protein D9M69_555680 [compost metagenome]